MFGVPFPLLLLKVTYVFLTIVDDFSRSTWVYMMQHKSDTRLLLQSFFVMVENQFNTTIKHIRTDNGSEFSMKQIDIQGIVLNNERFNHYLKPHPSQTMKILIS